MFLQPPSISKPVSGKPSQGVNFASHHQHRTRHQQPQKIRFYDNDKTHYGFTNFSPHGFQLDGKYWPTSEHYFQAQKFVDHPKIQEEIRTIPQNNPRKAFDTAHKYAAYERADWESVKDDIMRKAVMAKFSQHKALKQELLGTGDAILVEDSPKDGYWGRGANHKGHNMLGRILMETRTKLREAYNTSPPQPTNRASATDQLNLSARTHQAGINVDVQLQDIATFNADAIIINLYKGVKKPDGGTGTVDKALHFAVRQQIKTQDFQGDLGEVMVLSKGSKSKEKWPIPAEHVIIVGLGSRSADPIHILKTANRAALREIRENPLLADVKTAGTLLHCTGIGGFGGEDNVSIAAQALKQSTLEEASTHGAGSLQNLSIMDIDATRAKWVKTALASDEPYVRKSKGKKTTTSAAQSQQKQSGFFSSLWQNCNSLLNSIIQWLKRFLD